MDPIRLEKTDDGRFQVCQGPLKWPYKTKSELMSCGEKEPQQPSRKPSGKALTDDEMMMMLRIISVPAPDGETEVNG